MKARSKRAQAFNTANTCKTHPVLNKENFGNNPKEQLVDANILEHFKSFNLKHAEEGKVTAEDKDGVRHIQLNGTIGDFSDWGDDTGITDAKLEKAIGNFEGHIVIHGNSPGGYTREAAAMFNRLNRHPGKTTYVNEGLTASAATWLMMVADSRIATEMSEMMIHNVIVVGLIYGNKNSVKSLYDWMVEVDKSLVNLYTKRTKLTEEEVMDYMEEERFFNAESSKKAGFVSKVERRQREDTASVEDEEEKPEDIEEPEATNKEDKKVDLVALERQKRLEHQNRLRQMELLAAG